MGKIMECGALCSTPKFREALAIVRDDSFDVRALDPKSRCTVVSVAAHFLNEKTRRDILHGPGGALRLIDTNYEQLDERTVRVRGANFEPEAAGEYTVKLEGARKIGFQTIFIGGSQGPYPAVANRLSCGKDRRVRQRAASVPFRSKNSSVRIRRRDGTTGTGLIDPKRSLHLCPSACCNPRTGKSGCQQDEVWFRPLAVPRSVGNGWQLCLALHPVRDPHGTTVRNLHLPHHAYFGSTRAISD